MCCGQEARYINNGFNLQYWYCDECKKEVQEKMSVEFYPNSQKSIHVLLDLMKKDYCEYFKLNYSSNSAIYTNPMKWLRRTY